jgi:hypothetical protein
MTSAWLDRELVEDYVAGRLDADGEARLADEVARILPFHAQLPNPMVAALSRVEKRAGGEAGVFDLLERHPGPPRLVARLYRFMRLLDELTDEPAVIAALAEVRERTPYPPGLAEYLIPATDKTTLASLGQTIEALIGDGRTDEAARLADATAAMLQQAAPAVVEREPRLRGRFDELERIRMDSQFVPDKPQREDGPQ